MYICIATYCIITYLLGLHFIGLIKIPKLEKVAKFVGVCIAVLLCPMWVPMFLAMIVMELDEDF